MGLRNKARSSRATRVELLEQRRMFSFSPAVDYAAGENPQAVATADFNGDGRLDLAVGNYNYSASTVTVLLGNTNGTFSSDPRLTSPTGDSPRSLAVGDFNADGKLDLATGNTYDVSVLLGDGTGAFGAPASLNVYGSPAGVAVGDVNADGKLDLVAASNNYYPGGYGYAGFYQGHVVVLLGNGTGAFASPVATRVSTSGAPIASVALADFNGDRRLDAATVDTGSWWGGGHVAVALGNGTATFAPFAAVAAVDYAQSVTAADVSGDGRADLVTASANNGVGVTLGNGAGGFGDTRVYAPGTHVNSVALADFDGNGAVDLLTASPTDGAAGVLLGAGGGTFRPPLPAGTGSRPFPAAVGDFNGDRRVDAVSANDVSKRVSVLLNDGNWLATDAPSIGISDVTVTEGNAGAVNAALTLTLSAASTKTVTVSFATSDVTATAAEGDYAPSSGAVTFAPGELTKTINVAVNGDRTAESRELFWVVLSGATNAFVDDSAGLVSILDDEPRVSIDDYSAAEGNADTKSFTFTVRLSAPSDAPLSVNYSTAEGDTDYWPSDPYYGPPAATAGSDFQAGAGTVTFAPGETSQTITVTVNGDTDGEPDEVFSVNLGVPDGAEVTDGHAVGTIVDDEVYASITGGGSVAEGDAGTTRPAAGARERRPAGACFPSRTARSWPAGCACPTRRGRTTGRSSCWTPAPGGSCASTRQAARRRPSRPTSPASPAGWACTAATRSSACPRSARPPRWTASRSPPAATRSSAAWPSSTSAPAPSSRTWSFRAPSRKCSTCRSSPARASPR